MLGRLSQTEEIALRRAADENIPPLTLPSLLLFRCAGRGQGKVESADRLTSCPHGLKPKKMAVWLFPQNKRRRGGRYQTNPVPSQVDVVVITTFFDTTPDAVKRKVGDTLPGWLTKANGRPLLLRWSAWEQRPPGLVPKCQAGTMRAYAKIAEDHELAGLVLGHYGESWGCDGVDTKPALLKEIKEVSKNS